MKKTLIAISLLSFQLSFAQSGWFWQNPTPTGSNLGKTFFVNNNLVYANGTSSIFKSTNGGINWNESKLFPDSYDSTGSYFSLDISAFDQNNIYLLAAKFNFSTIYYNPFLMKTSNGGVTWDTLSIPYTGLNTFRKMKFINQNTGYCWNDVFMPTFKTTNAGANWQKLVIEGNDTLSDVYFINQNTGFISSVNYITGSSASVYFRTTNGGDNWAKHTVADFYPLYGINFINENTGWALVGDSIYKSSNGGINFTPFAPRPGLREIGFLNENFGWANSYNDVYITTNGGLNWTFSLKVNIGDDALPAINFRQDGTCLVTGTFGRTYKSTNFGASWTNYFKFTGNYYTFEDVNFISSSTGIAVGPAKIMRTSDGGENWNITDSLYYYKNIKFLNQSTVVINADSILGRSTDAGLTWSYTLFPKYIFNEIFAFNNTIYTVGRINNPAVVKLFKSTNSGLSWSTIDIPSSLIGTNFFLNENTGWFGNQKTTNGGLNWFSTGSNITYPKKIYFANENTGWCISDSALLKSTNGGATWVRKLNNKPYSSFISLNFANQNTGYAYSGINGVIYKTTNSGETWVQNNNLKAYTLYAGSFIDANTGWLVGANGTILKTTTGGFVAIQQISTTLPHKFYLSQNYPNPFNPITNIEFSLPQKTFVKLKVFDLLGREVANLINENLSAGSYKYDFIATALTSGIYFYKLETENFSETRKMVLIK